MLTWLPIGQGRLSVRGRPGKVFWSAVSEEGITSIVTLLSEREGGQGIGQRASEVGLNWIWLPLENGDIPTEAVMKQLSVELPKLATALYEGESMILHCSAGIHRTGMIAYVLLRLCGLDDETARAGLLQMRVETAAGVGDKRLHWGDDFVRQIQGQADNRLF